MHVEVGEIDVYLEPIILNVDQTGDQIVFKTNFAYTEQESSLLFD